MIISFYSKCLFHNETEYSVCGHPSIKQIKSYSLCGASLLKYRHQSLNSNDPAFKRTIEIRQGGVKLAYVARRYIHADNCRVDYHWPQNLYLVFVQWLKDEHAKYLIEQERLRVKFGYTQNEYPTLEARLLPRPIFYNPQSRRYEGESWFQQEMASWN
jgi:hypothetical protein